MTDYIAICAGGGLGCRGFELAGWELKCAIELDEGRRRLLKHRFPKASMLADLKAVKASDLPPVRAWFSTTPCTSFSQAGKRDGLGSPEGRLMLDVFRLYAEAVKHGNAPQFVVMENVPGLLSSPAWSTVQDAATAAGLFPLAADLLDARQFRVPQERKRLFAVWSAEPITRKPEPIKTADWKPFRRTQMPECAFGARVNPNGLQAVLTKLDTAYGGSLADRKSSERTRAFCGSTAKPECWSEFIAVYVDNGAGSVGIGQSPTLAKRSRSVMALDWSGEPRELKPEGWEWLMGMEVGWTDVPWLSDRERRETCGDGICALVAAGVGDWLRRLP